MKISQTLPQFEKNAALIIVCGGKQEAVFYHATDGRIREINSFRTAVRDYTDKEGAYRIGNAHGRTFQAGTIVDEHRKHEIIGKFLRQLERKILQRLRELKPREVYLFVPKHIAPEVYELIPKRNREQLKLVVNGNFESSHPFDLLKRIKKDTRSRRATPHSAEAVRLLHKGEYTSNKRR